MTHTWSVFYNGRFCGSSVLVLMGAVFLLSFRFHHISFLWEHSIHAVTTIREVISEHILRGGVATDDCFLCHATCGLPCVISILTAILPGCDDWNAISMYFAPCSTNDWNHRDHPCEKWRMEIFTIPRPVLMRWFHSMKKNLKYAGECLDLSHLCAYIAIHTWCTYWIKVRSDLQVTNASDIQLDFSLTSARRYNGQL